MEIARAFVREGARVHICDVDEKALAAAEKKRAEGQDAWAAKLVVKPETVLWQPLTIKTAISRNTQTIKPQIENDGTTVYVGGNLDDIVAKLKFKADEWRRRWNAWSKANS